MRPVQEQVSFLHDSLSAWHIMALVGVILCFKAEDV